MINMSTSGTIWLALSFLILVSSEEHQNSFRDRPVSDFDYKVRHDYGSSPSAGNHRFGEYPRKRRQYGYGEAVGPVHTFVKTDEHAHFKWGVRHHVG
ncbi:UNVERIFIED_CONTAM: hypothetical protein PYX00_004439 [Menopon gallinae]|uniref:Uncharacterized protein n=1 Tax=Menopon gallinae TaxID=328185 RepID=A0AAW2I476_9NEOP